MLVSLSASLERYEWFEYQGKKKKEFNNHHKSYDLEIENKDRYGVRLYSGKYKLVILQEPKNIFTLSKAEVDSLKKASVGYSGTVKGTKLKAGQGGLDSKKITKRISGQTQDLPTVDEQNIRVYNVDGEFKEYPKKYFPLVPVPPSTKDITRLYHYFNKLHFDQELPKDIKIRISTAVRTAGMARYRYNRTTYQPEYGLQLSKMALTDIPRICDILIHEMIHILMYKRLIEDGDRSYLKVGHGPKFLEEMNRINKFGYKINVVDNGSEGVLLDNTIYCLLLALAEHRGYYYLIYDFRPFKEHVQKIVEDFTIKSYHTIEKYEYGISSDSVCLTAGQRLTKSFKLPKKLNRGYGFLIDTRDAYTTFRKYFSVKEENTLVGDEGIEVRKQVQIAVQKKLRYLYFSFTRYLAECLLHFASAEIEHALLNLQRTSGDDVYSVVDHVLSRAEFNFIYDKWFRAEDGHLITPEMQKSVTKNLLLLKIDHDEAIARGLDYINRLYEKDERVDNDRKIELLLLLCGDVISYNNSDIRKIADKQLNGG